MKSYRLFVLQTFLFQFKTCLSWNDRHQPFWFLFKTDTSPAPHNKQALIVGPTHTQRLPLEQYCRPTHIQKLPLEQYCRPTHIQRLPLEQRQRKLAFLCAHVRIKGFWAVNHLHTFANQNVTIYNLNEKPEGWLPSFPHKLKRSKGEKDWLTLTKTVMWNNWTHY